MTKRKIDKAAKIYMLSCVANGQDCGGAESEEEDLMMSKAIDLANSRLLQMGVDPSEVLSAKDCLSYVNRSS